MTTQKECNGTELENIVDLYLGLRDKHNFVLKCNIARQNRNFPMANLLEPAILEFNIMLRRYQREVPPEVKKYGTDIVEGYVREVKEIENQSSNPQEQESFHNLQMGYYDGTRKRYCEDMLRRR